VSVYVRELIFCWAFNDSFDMVKSQTLLLDPLSRKNRVYSISKVLQHERGHGSTPVDEIPSLIVAQQIIYVFLCNG
jgi:hypothetical protein